MPLLPSARSNLWLELHLLQLQHKRIVEQIEGWWFTLRSRLQLDAVYLCQTHNAAPLSITVMLNRASATPTCLDCHAS